mgnify:CR=1 FL=1
MRKVVFYMMAAALLSGCNARNGNIMQIEEQGSFAVGGTVLTDSLGRTYHGDHATCSIRNPSMPGNTRLSSPTAWGSFPRHGKLRRTAARGSRIFSCAAVSRLISSTSPAGETRGGARHPATRYPRLRRGDVFNRFRVGIWPDYFEGVQFSRDKEALNQYFRQMTPTLGPPDLDVYAKAYAALFDRIGPAVFVTHSQGGGVGWLTLPQTRNIRAIVAYEPGTNVPFPKQMPEEGKVLTLSKKTEGVEVPMEEFLQFTKIPIIIYYGDNLPETDERPELYEWTRRLHLMRKWAALLNEHGGDVTVIHLPEIGLKGNTHFPFSDLNNVEVADHLSRWLHEKGLD